MQHQLSTHRDSVRKPSVLAALRGLHPNRALTVFEALRIAELQAARMLAMSDITDAPVPAEIIEALPRIVVEYDDAMPGVTSGACDWDAQRGSWVITLNPAEPDTRVRMTTCHEYKHILDHGKPPLLCRPERRYYSRPAAEYVADYFAGCLLMPKRFLAHAWYSGIQHLDDLATMFDVSPAAITVRLRQLGLIERSARCDDTSQRRPGNVHRPGHGYLRQLSNNWQLSTTTKEDHGGQTAAPLANA